MQIIIKKNKNWIGKVLFCRVVKDDDGRQQTKKLHKLDPSPFLYILKKE